MLENAVLYIYLIGQADRISGAFGFITFLSITGLLICGFAHAVADVRIPKWLLGLIIPCVIIGGMGNMFFPSSKTLTLMLAGSAVVETAKSEKVQSIASNSLTLVEKYIQSKLEELTVSDAKKK